jgi:membrane protein
MPDTSLLDRARRFLTDTLWQVDPRNLGWPRRVGLRAGRVAICILRDLAEGQLTLRAMSLVYTTLLSLVPLLAVSFSVLKAFGAHNQIEPFLIQITAPLGPKGAEVTERIIGFVDNTQVGVLGAFGLAFLFYTVVALIQKIERAFNETWHVKSDRPLARRFSDYLSVVLIGPVLVFSAVGITASLASNVVVDYLAGVEPFGTIINVVGRMIPYLLVIAAFTFIYILVPNTRVRLRCAFTGAVVAGVLWASLGWGFATFVVSTGKYTAIYSAFATLLFFMIWLYLSWMVLLVGSSVAFYVQNPQFMGRERGAPRLSNRLREQLGIAVMDRVARDFQAGERPPGVPDIASTLRVPSAPVQEVLAALEDGGLVRCTQGEPTGWLPARPLGNIGAWEVLQTLRTAGEDIRLAAVGLDQLPTVSRVFERLDEAGSKALEDLTADRWRD